MIGQGSDDSHGPSRTARSGDFPAVVPKFSDTQIVAARGPKNAVDPFRPYHALVEPEFSANRIVEDCLTVFLANRECPFRCLMCDLWKNTTDERVPAGAIPEQIQYALQSLPPAPHIKLYNSGNFFDRQAIPGGDLPRVAELVGGFQSVIVENHPRLCNDRCLEFQQLCGTTLEVAMGLETSHEPTLQTLNKQMTTGDFARACEFLSGHSIRLRAFVLLRPPGLTQQEGIEQAIRSVEFAFRCGADCCAVIPTRSGNGIMDQLQQDGLFQPPSLAALEIVLEETLRWKKGRVFADLWDAAELSDCGACLPGRIERLNTMNLTQRILPAVECDQCRPESDRPR